MVATSAQLLVYFGNLLLGNVCIKRLSLLDLRLNLEPLPSFSRGSAYTFWSQEYKSPDCFHGSVHGFLCNLSVLCILGKPPITVFLLYGSISSMQTGKKNEPEE